MIQSAIGHWYIESDKGKIIQQEITCGNKADALDYIKRYVSSFEPEWEYEVIALEDICKRK